MVKERQETPVFCAMLKLLSRLKSTYAACVVLVGCLGAFVAFTPETTEEPQKKDVSRWYWEGRLLTVGRRCTLHTQGLALMARGTLGRLLSQCLLMTEII